VNLLGKPGGGVLCGIRGAGKAQLDLLRKFQTTPPMMRTWNSGLLNSKFVSNLELELPPIQFHGILWR
jgi:hypothetical protein